MKRPRDSQRSRLYKAETVMSLETAISKGKRLKTVPEMQAFVDEVLTTEWWESRFPDIRRIVVTDGRRRRKAGAVRNRLGNFIKMPKWSRWTLFVLHEIAHIARPVGTAAHGREICKIYLDLVCEFMSSAHADRLREQYRRFSVEWIVRIKRNNPLRAGLTRRFPVRECMTHQEDAYHDSSSSS